MQRFIDDDDAYLHWARSHRDGFVVNCLRSLSPRYLILHRADCRTITGTPARGETWTGEYIKVCSESRRELQGWAREETGGSLKACQICDP